MALEDTVRELQSQVAALQQRLDQLQQQFSISPNEIRMTCGDNSIRLTPMDFEIRALQYSVTASANVHIKAGGKATFEAQGDTYVAASGRVVLDGSQVLAEHLEAQDQMVISCGDATIVLKKDGHIAVKGHEADIAAMGKASIKAGGVLSLKGSRIIEN